MSEKPRRSPSFFPALIGGLVVAVFGMIAINAGWIDASPDDSGDQSSRAAAVVGQNIDSGVRTVNEIFREVSPGVAFISASRSPSATPGASPFGEPDEGRGGGTGSGFVVDSEGHIVTNAHVVSGADEIEVVLGGENETYEAEVIGVDESTDIAVLKIEADPDALHPVPLGDSSVAEVGDAVVAVGNPFGLDRTVTTGIVSALQREIQAPNGYAIRNVIQTDAPINPGNSGGPLLNVDGEVIGVNSQIASTSGGNIGIGFAVPSNTVRQVMDGLINEGRIDHAFMGVTGFDITDELAAAINLPVDEGVLVQSVTEDGPAEKAGLVGGTAEISFGGTVVAVGGDVIVAIDGKPVTSMSQVGSAVDERQPGDQIEVTYYRKGKRETATVTLGARPASPTSR